MAEIRYEDIARANNTCSRTNIKGKEYIDVAQRIKAFRMVYPRGTIRTDMIYNEGGMCIFRAEVYDGDLLLASGTSYEKASSSGVNSTSYIENAETSAVGRALGMTGFGSDTSIASADEVANAISNQGVKPTAEALGDEAKASKTQIETIGQRYVGAKLQKLLAANGLERLEDMTRAKASDIIVKLQELDRKKAAAAAAAPAPEPAPVPEAPPVPDAPPADADELPFPAEEMGGVIHG